MLRCVAGPVNIVKILQRALKLHPASPAVQCGGHTFTYEGFAERVSRLAAALRTEGVTKGCCVAALLPNCHRFLELYFAAPLAGGILVPLNHRLSPREIASIVGNAEPSLLVADARYKELAQKALKTAGCRIPTVWAAADGWLPDGALEYEHLLASVQEPISLRAPLEIRSQEPAQIYYTSGTTGKPKGVVLTHQNVWAHALMALAELGLSDRDAWLHAAPMFHLADAWACFALTAVGGRHVMAADFRPQSVLDIMENDGITLTNLIPTMLKTLVNHPGASERRFAALRLVLSGGAPISPELVRNVIETFKCDYYQTYGLTETSPFLTMSKLKASLERLPEDERFWYRASTGRPMIGVELRVVDESGNDVPADRKTVGEIAVRGPSVTPGYWRTPEQTRMAFRNGWFYTGDLAVMDAEGYVNIVDRKKDVIVTGGEQVFSVEVENALQEHPDVLEAAVFAVPDDKWGEAVKALVVLRADGRVAAQDLIDFCRQRLATYKAPKTVEFVSELAKTGSHKVDKRRIRDAHWKGHDRRVH